MKIKMEQILSAVPAMNKLVAAELPLKTAHQITIMVDKLNPHIRFFEQKRSALVGKEQADAEGKMRELLDYQVDAELTPVDISLEEDVRLSASDVNALRPFVHFIGKEETKDR